uniref:PGG domain-containing protein n=1 Tax=Davidia involucrata TaxID=16924 RepID=A0A5B6Z2K7_DAVIN
MASEIEVNIQEIHDDQNEKQEVADLFEVAMRGKWMKVVDVYRRNPLAREAKLTKSGDTALHIAVADGNEDIVKKLAESIPEKDASRILNLKNERENTPLHLAAALGNVAICRCIGLKCPNVINARTVEGETPLFLAVHHGKQEAFLCLHQLYKKGKEIPDYTPCRNHNGNTILHSAISGEYFSLAFQIITYYPKLVDFVNANGFSPLHTLASKPNVFRSSSRLRLFDRIIYHCIPVNELKKDRDPEAYKNNSAGKSDLNYPENYQTCMSFFKLPKTAIWVLASPGKGTSWKRSCCTDESGISSDEENLQQKSSHDGDEARRKDKRDHLFPDNYASCVLFFKFVMKALLIILGFGFGRIKKIHEKKVKHAQAVQIMNKLVEHVSTYKYDNNGMEPQKSSTDKDRAGIEFPTLPPSMDYHNVSSKPEMNTSTNSLAANQNKDQNERDWQGLVAIQDLDSNKKNVVLLAVENRQADVYNLFLTRRILKDSMLYQLDNQGNSALHLAAMNGEHQPWLIPGAALQMQWEIKWYKFVKHSMPSQFFVRSNKKGETPRAIFRNTHKDLMKNGSEWLTKTSESCSVVAALIATVAFATSATVPGGVNQETGTPTLVREPAFDTFAVSSLAALCFSVTALVFFLAILTSRCQEKDFHKDLPRKLLLGLTSLFTSIASMLVSFCAGHFFILKDNLKYAAFPVYTVTCLPVTFFAFAQLPLYFDLIWAILTKVPQRSYKVFPN